MFGDFTPLLKVLEWVATPVYCSMLHVHGRADGLAASLAVNEAEVSEEAELQPQNALYCSWLSCVKLREVIQKRTTMLINSDDILLLTCVRCQLGRGLGCGIQMNTGWMI